MKFLSYFFISLHVVFIFVFLYFAKTDIINKDYIRAAFDVSLIAFNWFAVCCHCNELKRKEVP